MAIDLQIENISKSFGDLVLFNDISFTIEERQRIGLIACNGKGKSTLLKVIAGEAPIITATTSECFMPIPMTLK